MNKSRFGLLTIGETGFTLPFVLRLVRDRSDWLTLGVPVAALRSRYTVEDTWTAADQPWLIPLSRTLADVADRINRHAPILTGTVGEEASGCWRSSNFEDGEGTDANYPPLAVVTAEIIERRGGFVIPPALWRHLAPEAEPVVLSSGLLYIPPRPDAALTEA